MKCNVEQCVFSHGLLKCQITQNLILEMTSHGKSGKNRGNCFIVYESGEERSCKGTKSSEKKCEAFILHPGNNKQRVPFVLAIFDESNYAAICS